MKIRQREIDKEMERAIIMLVDCVKKKCRNEKPVILHSLRVGFKLFEMGQPKEVVIAGLLHDLVEDTNCTLRQIKDVFGDRVAILVSAVTQVKEKDYKKRWLILMKKIEKAGKAAMLLKLIDVGENVLYVPFIKEKEEIQAVYWKHNFVMKWLKPYFGTRKIYREYRDAYQKVFKKLL